MLEFLKVYEKEMMFSLYSSLFEIKRSDLDLFAWQTMFTSKDTQTHTYIPLHVHMSMCSTV